MRRLFLWGVFFTILSLPLGAKTVADFEGRTVSINVRPQRIVSLAPIATRVIAQFEQIEQVVGLDQGSLAMDLLPIPISERGTSITNLGNARTVNEEAILRLRPDIIITQYDRAAADRLSGRTGVPVLCIQNRNDMDYELYELLGKVLFSENRSTEIIAYMKSIVLHAEATVQNSNNVQPPRVYVATDTSLLNTFPHDPIVKICGSRNVGKEITSLNYWGGATVNVEFLIRSRPDVIIVWIVFNAPNQITELKNTLSRKEYANIPAIRNNRVYSFIAASSGKDYFYTMVSISETLHNFYPEQYNAQMLERDIKAHLKLFYPSVDYAEYKQLRDRVNIR